MKVLLCVILTVVCGSVFAQNHWQLAGNQSSLHYISMKKDHTAEINTFLAESGEPAALNGSINDVGDAILSIDLNDVSTGVTIRNDRLRSLLFRTDLLPTAYFKAHIDLASVVQMAAGEIRQQALSGEFILHAVRQTINTQVLITKLDENTITVASLQPILIDSKRFDLAAGVEALRLVANLSSISEMVPVYFHLRYQRQGGDALKMPEAPTAPASLAASFDPIAEQASLSWQDTSNLETAFLVRRKPLEDVWQTSAVLTANQVDYIENLPELGDVDYKVIALNQGIPSLPSNIERITVTEVSQLERGRHVYGQQCAGCHGVEGEGVGSFPAIDQVRDLDAMIAYIIEFMPHGNPDRCDSACAEDVATFIQTLWVSEFGCNPSLTPVSYGARQLKILTRAEYQRSVEALIGVNFDVASGLSADQKIGFFANNTFAGITPSAYSNYLLVAERMADWSAERNFRPALSCNAFDSTCVQQLLDGLAPTMFRRPLTADEQQAYQAMADGSYTEGNIKDGIKMAMEALLSSPQFLYRHELGTRNPSNGELASDAFELTSYEMATYLAYTFTGSTPDEQLLAAAARDELRDTHHIMTHAARLADSGKTVLDDFVGSWLGTAELASAAKDTQLWPNFSAVVPHLNHELNATFAHVMLTPDESFSSLYGANYSFLNSTLANHYGISGIEGNELRKVSTIARGGILANGAFMARWGEAVESSPILRSVRVRRRMLCQDQPDPPAGTFEAREQKS